MKSLSIAFVKKYFHPSGEKCFNLIRFGIISFAHNNFHAKNTENTSKILKINKDELKKRIGDLSYHVTQEKGTEMPFSGDYYNNNISGVYQCIVCGESLFISDHKYDSKSGWPSFYETPYKENLKINTDYGHGMRREEVCCSNCDAHLGHIFDDGPSPTYKRYCINSAALNFKEK